MATVGARVDDYSRFDAAHYIRTRFPDPDETRTQFYLRHFHEFYQQYHTQWDHTGARLLEFGGGPIIIPLISAAPFVSEIVFSEYADSCRNEVQLWKDNDPKAFDWMPYIRHVVNKLEQKVDCESAAVRAQTLRSRIHHIVSCDINADQKHLLGCEAVQEPFDIISMNGCIEAVVKSHTQYQQSIAKLKTLMKPGGLLVGVQFLGLCGWEIQGEKYHCFPLTEELVVTSLQQAGFTLLEKKLSTRFTVSETTKTITQNGTATALFVATKAN